jgi:uncharacterized membrane protein YhaH (DUF805 family)
MGMQDAVRSFITRYSDFQGRSSRSEFWWVYLASILLGLAIGIVFGIVSAISDTLAMILMVPLLLACLALIVPSLALTFRRLHDSEKSAWWMLISLIPLGGIVLLVFYVLPGTTGPNKFGPDPLSNQAEAFA